MKTTTHRAQNGADVSATDRITQLYSGAKDRVVAGAKATDSAIRDKPYHSLAIAAAVGAIIGVLVGRRTR
ncbi:MAG: hypothetical protein JWM88_3133 [Verrucomicrobia bacterium]|nr:hypothetical protein [Verrucomicrobiota bacterium]